jgi:hypothetical protein
MKRDDRYHDACLAEERCATWLSEGELASTLERIRPFVMPPVSTDALVDVANLVRVILKQNIPGDFVECGVWKGGTAFLMAELLKQAGIEDRKVWLFDSFDGMPQVEDIDGATAKAEANNPNSFLSAEKSKASIDEVRRSANDLGLAPYIEFVQGWFAETLAPACSRMGPVALLHIDCDWYSSVRCCLENLYDQVADGGFIFLDDYYHYDGCTIAIHEFLAKRGLPFRIETVEGKQWGGCEYYYAARFRKGGTNWKAQYVLDLAAQDLAEIIALDQAVIIVGEELRQRISVGRRTMPFLELRGEYWGKPSDDETAIRELERLRGSGSDFIAFAWTAFWWLDQYPGFARHLESRYRKSVSNDRLVLVDLRSGQAALHDSRQFTTLPCIAGQP